MPFLEHRIPNAFFNILNNLLCENIVGLIIEATKIVLIVFGPLKLPEIGKSVGKILKEFKNAIKDIMNDDR
ncbi:twin-arginine translocase TatA/TatE family subunit [Cerasibacillus terrae]|uniref:Twin-arginine translocase TatA/TatE family subunit n=1 Tax=Cerasibacillus terrae TaxID=2498845 RepID=A0A5C8NZV2_9BACI|nr:twin-arginine translocase TatA/TatE family subunit [Cerasibacillus terrae]